MKFAFKYEQTLSRLVTIDAENVNDALAELYRRIDKEELVLDSEDYVGTEVFLPLDYNRFMQLMKDGERVDDVTSYDLMVDCW